MLRHYCGLTDAEIREVDAWVRRNTGERFGPVRSVRPELVFELGFAGIAPSARHQERHRGALSAELLRWRHDKPVTQADTLAGLHALLRRSRPEAVTSKT